MDDSYRHLANFFEAYHILLDYGPLAPWYENTTSPAKRKYLKVSQRHQKRTEVQHRTGTGTMHKNLVKFDRAVYEICERSERLADKLTDTHQNTLLLLLLYNCPVRLAISYVYPWMSVMHVDVIGGGPRSYYLDVSPRWRAPARSSSSSILRAGVLTLLDACSVSHQRSAFNALIRTRTDGRTLLGISAPPSHRAVYARSRAVVARRSRSPGSPISPGYQPDRIRRSAGPVAAAAAAGC